MTRQEKLLLEYSKFQKPQRSLTDTERKLRMYGVKNLIIGEGSEGDENTFIEYCDKYKWLFKNAIIDGFFFDLSSFDAFFTFKSNSEILSGNFISKSVLELKDTSCIRNGDFDIVSLSDESTFYKGKANKVELYNNSVFLGNDVDTVVLFLNPKDKNSWKINTDTLNNLRDNWGGNRIRKVGVVPPNNNRIVYINNFKILMDFDFMKDFKHIYFKN